MSNRDPLIPEEEARLWREFFAECLLVYGEKRGTFKELLLKAVERAVPMSDAAAFRLAFLRAIDDHSARRGSQITGGNFDLGRFMASCDEANKQRWRKSYDPVGVVAMYMSLTDPVDAHLPPSLQSSAAAPMDKREAIERVKAAFGFPSFEACHKFLERAGVDGLPATWPD